MLPEAGLHLADRLGVEGEVAQGELPGDGLQGHIEVGAAGDEGGQAAPDEAHQVAAHHQGAVLLVEAAGDLVPSLDEEVAQAEELDLFVVGVRGQQVEEVGHAPAVGRLAARHHVALPAVARAGDRSWVWATSSAASATTQPSRAIRAIMLQKVMSERTSPNVCCDHARGAVAGLALGLLQRVVEARVLEEAEVEPVGVLHEHQLHAVGGQLLQSLLVDVA